MWITRHLFDRIYSEKILKCRQKVEIYKWNITSFKWWSSDATHDRSLDTQFLITCCSILTGIHAISSVIRCIKAHPHCKSTDQIGGATWPSGMVGQLKSPGVDDKPSGFIASNRANRLRHPIRLNVGKCQRIACRLRSLWFFLAAIFVIHSPSPITIAGPSNLQYCFCVKHFWKF